ncbi:isoprene monooxygenase ferredoxin [Rhodococcus sp. WS1]|uniref:isoprene monooxygenase ferredoxin n=1 Tax=unclassified Rhodococcus (in: high G+C Gram-positive bacteria) TaxID=192944 RepID=UPI0011433168|nr:MULTISPECIES: isoprene monooxygenase ferredoxin [unclassified Rhodococcus (in: high G+C Gram-positive bacteria)]ROZ52964.1 isoprene monooxygenase ferredoxin [Rhodococcus sp. WS1]TQC36057.1 isoprene monooxygenase ferredoxin [Rhodococcus sp. WS7]
MSDDPDNDYVDLVAEDELWDNEMESFDLGDDEVLVLKVDGEVRAYDGICPHQSISLVEGEFENGVVTCRAHEWQFDALTGAGVNPRDTCLHKHDVRIVDGVIQVRLKSPVQAHH